MDTDNRAAMARGKEKEGLGGGQKRENGDICNSVNNKNKVKNI